MWTARGALRSRSGDAPGAIADCTQAIAVDPRTGDAYALRGMARSSKGDLAGATADFEEFLRLAPKHPDAPGIRDWLEKQAKAKGR